MKEKEILKEKVSLKKLKEIFQKHNEKYSDEQIITIRDFMFELAEIDYAVFVFNEKKELQFKNEEAEINNQIEYKSSA